VPKINKKDFVEIEYTGRIKDGDVFDTTSVEVAKEKGIYNDRTQYAPAVLCVGEHQIIKGLDKYLEGRDVGEEYEVELKPEEAFGKKDAKMLRIVPTAIFKKQNIQPVPGLQLNMDGVVGTIKTVTGGRTVVDFNHPLSGRDLVYKIKITGLIKDTKEKIKAYIKTQFGVDAEVNVEGEKAEIDLKQEAHKDLLNELREKLIKITSIKEVLFEQEKKEIDKKNREKEKITAEIEKQEVKKEAVEQEVVKKDAKTEQGENHKKV